MFPGSFCSFWCFVAVCRLFNSGTRVCKVPVWWSPTTVTEYTLEGFGPAEKISLLEFRGASSVGLTGPVHTPCDITTRVRRADGFATQPQWAQGRGRFPPRGKKVVTISHTVYRLSRFDITNPYKAMHAYLNAFITIMTLGLVPESLQIVFEDDFGHAGEDSFDHDFWTLIAPNYAQVKLGRGRRLGMGPGMCPLNMFVPSDSAF